MNEQLHDHMNTVENDCLGSGALNIDFLTNLKISLNLKKSMSILYFKDLNVVSSKKTGFGSPKTGKLLYDS